VAAVKSILAAFSESIQYEDTPQDQIDAAIDTYITMLDEHDNSRRLAAAHGRRLEAINDKDDEGADQAESRKCPSESPNIRTPSKRCSPDKSLFAWLANDDADTTVLTPSQELTHNLVQNHLLDLKSSKWMVLSSKRVPKFPDSEWNNVLAGKVVNIDVVFSHMYSTITDNRAIKNIGNLKLHFGATKPAKTVETHGDWVIAWRSVFKATKFIFPHCEAELNEYHDYITSYFASIHSSAHPRVLNLNRAIRKQVGSVNNISLNEFGKFRSKLVTSKVMALAKAASSLKRGQSKKMGLIQVGGKLIPAVCGMIEDVVTKHPRVSSDTFARFAEDYTARDLALVRKALLMPKCVSDAHHAWEHQGELDTPKSGQRVQISTSCFFEAHCLCLVTSMTSYLSQVISWAKLSNTINNDTLWHLGHCAICHQVKPPRITLGPTKK
jgi:nucleoid DNA-binding protein